jgi:hypothetical protein
VKSPSIFDPAVKAEFNAQREAKKAAQKAKRPKFPPKQIKTIGRLSSKGIETKRLNTTTTTIYDP